MPLLQYLNGVIDVPQPFEGVTLPPDYPTVGVLGGLCDYDMAGLAAMATHSDLIDQVTGEHALDEYNGINGVEDCELLRSYLLKTKGVVDACPQMIQTYVNPEEFSNMLDYVLRYWDTDARETAVEKIASRELALIESGKVRVDDTDTDGVGGGFFNALWVCVRPQSELAQATQEVLSVYKGKLRNAAAYARENDGKVTAELLSGLSGMDDEEVGSTSLIYGWDYHEEQDGLSGEETITVADVVSPDVDYCERYLRNMYNMISARPSDFFAQETEGQQFVNALGIVLDNFHSGKLDNVIAQLSNNRQFGGLFKKMGKAIKKAVKATGKGIANATKATGKGIANATKAVGKGVANAVKAVGKAFKKLGKKIAKVVKKVVKFLIRFNPLTACIRGILILAARFNWFKLAEKCYPGSFATYAEAKVKCATTTTTNGKKTISYISEDYYKKCKDLYGKFKNVYTKIGGYESKLKSNLEKGSKKKWKGGEVTTASVSKASVKKLKDENGGDKAAQAEAETEFKAVEQTAANKKGSSYTLTEDSKIEVGTSKVEKKTVEVTANEFVTTQATNFYLETATDKVSCSIPKGTKLIIDATDKGVPILYDQTGENTKGTYYRTQYNNKYGIILKSCVKSTLSGLMGLDEYDESLCGFFSRRKKKKNQKQAVSTAKGVGATVSTIKVSGKTGSSSASNSTSKTSSLFSRIRSKMQSGVKTVVKKLPSSATTKAEAAKNKNKVTAKTKKVVAKNTKTGQIGYVDQIEVIYDNNGHALGIWLDVAMAIASATSTLTGLVSAMLKAFGKDKAANALAITSAATGVAAVGFGVGSQVATAASSAKSSTSTTAAKSSSTTAAKTSNSTAQKASTSTTAAKSSSTTTAKTSNSTAQKASTSTTATKSGSTTTAKPTTTTTSTAKAINNGVKSNISTVTSAANTVKNATSVANKITATANKINNVASTTGAGVTQAVVNTANLVKQIKAEKQATAAVTTPQKSSTQSTNTTNTTTTQSQAQATTAVASSLTTDKKKLLTYGAIGLGSVLILGLVLGGRRN